VDTPQTIYPYPQEGGPPPEPGRRRRAASFFGKDRAWLNILLFVLTIISLFVVGVSWSTSYKYAEEIGRNPDFVPGPGAFKDPQIIRLSLIYALVLIVILLGHEMGHYLTCRRYGLSATLPFFIPAPTLIGTMGAFIKIRSPVTGKKQLFDIGAAGPLMSFILSVPALAVGVALSKVVPALPRENSILFGEPLLLKALGGALIKNAGPGQDIILHPVAFAGWVGLLVTAMNLFPLGQLDGGHVAYAILGPKSKLAAKLFLVVFVALGIFYWAGWLIWALVILLMGLKHPPTWDESAPIGRKRCIVGVLIVVIFVLSFIPDPIQGYNGLDLIRQIWPL
jgi:membrane-associated protease RseP (regulator of RpoE activity)